MLVERLRSSSIRRETKGRKEKPNNRAATRFNSQELDRHSNLELDRPSNQEQAQHNSQEEN